MAYVTRYLSTNQQVIGARLNSKCRTMAHSVCIRNIIFLSVVFVGYAGQFGWKFGLAATFIGFGNAFIGSLFAWVVLGRRTRVMTQQLNERFVKKVFICYDK